MARSADAIINPELLIWGRDTSGLSLEEAARRVGVTEERLSQWEAGDRPPTVNQLRTIANVYRRPFAAFYLPVPPTTFRVPHDFRTVGDAVPESGSASPKMRNELRRIAYQRSLAADLASPDEVVPVSFLGYVTRNENVEKAALKARQLLGVDLAEQTSWETDYNAFNGWRRAFEAIGILVFQIEDVEVDELRGFSIPEVVYPAIAANAKDSPYGRVFTLFHEFVHLLINAPGLCDLHHADQPRTNDQRTERFCNAVAAAALLPREPVLSSLEIGTVTERSDWKMDDIKMVASLFGTSREAVLLRLVTLGATTFEFYLKQRTVFQKEFAKARERQRLKEKERGTGFGLPPAGRAVRRLGPSLTRIFLSAYDREELTTSDLSEYLGVRIKHFQTVRRLVSGPTVEGAGSR